jgi:hypothetical protein
MAEQLSVLCYRDIDHEEIANLLARFHLEIEITENNHDIPGSYWGGEEAGLIGNRLYVRADTPLHSILHESCHFICMDSERREKLDTNAKSDNEEENAVCYLQILLAESLSLVSRSRLFDDMDAWGYSFRLGSTKAWFLQDASEARDWLVNFELIDAKNRPTFQLR